MLSVSIKSLEHITPDCAPEDDPCFMATTEYPVFEGAFEASANKVVNNTILDAMGLGDVESNVVVDFTSQFGMMDHHLKQLVEETGFRQGWTLQIRVPHLYQNDTLISAGVEIMTYFGGAHPNTNTVFFNFDRRNGNRLGYTWLQKQQAEAHIEAGFRQHFNLTSTDSLNKAGTWFQHNSISLPANFGFTESGLIIHYNAYEIAPYATGAISFEIPAF